MPIILQSMAVCSGNRLIHLYEAKLLRYVTQSIEDQGKINASKELKNVSIWIS